MIVGKDAAVGAPREFIPAAAGFSIQEPSLTQLKSMFSKKVLASLTFLKDRRLRRATSHIVWEISTPKMSFGRWKVAMCRKLLPAPKPTSMIVFDWKSIVSRNWYRCLDRWYL